VLFLVLLAGSFTLYFGCSQPEDIITGKTRTILDLSAERLPSSPPEMVYQLWVADSMIDESIHEAVSIARFRYDFDTDTYLDENGLPREEGNRFEFEGDVLTYRWLLITVQGDLETSVGPVMLIDTIIDPDDNPLDLVFPLSDSVSQSAVEFNMESSSDGRDPVTDGAAIWFTEYFERVAYLQDTTALTDWSIDTVWKDSFTENDGECVRSIVNISNIRDTVIQSIFGFDTVEQQIILYDVETYEECDYGQCTPGDPCLLTTRVNLSFSASPMDSLVYDDFLQLANPLPDYSSYGWCYKGWVVSSVINDLGVSRGEITPPAWINYNRFDSLLRGIDGGLLSTGKFTDLNQPDSANPYVDGVNPARVPPFPGEDFLKNLPGGVDQAINLVPGGEIKGTVFITLEPTNYVFDTTNFPLFVMIRDLPDTREQVESTVQVFIMNNRTNYNRDVLVGFPRVNVQIQRF